MVFGRKAADPRSFNVLVAEPRFLLVKGHTAAGVTQFCVCHGPDNTRDQAETQAWWRCAAALIRSVCQGSFPLVVQCDASARVGSVASLAADGEDTAGAEFHTLLLEWDFLSSSHVARPAQRPRQAFRNVVFQDAVAWD